MISIKNVKKTYPAGDGNVIALKNISLNFRKREFVSILGQSGCGKTTLLNIIGGLDRYDCGDICINNISTKNFKDGDWDNYRNHYIGFVFQNYNLIPHLSVLENVELALSVGGVGKKEKRKMALDALAEVGLKEQAKKRPNQLSGGQMQRVAIARAIVNNPEIILADEPTGALDSETSVQVMNALKKISRTHLVIMVTHNHNLAEKYSTRIIKLHDGSVVDDSKPYNVKNVGKNGKITKKSAMSLFTAFALSFKNLLTKKGKSFLVSFAGSIGIIGIALVLAVSNGFTGYINEMQNTTLGNYPITVSAISIDMDSFANVSVDKEKNDVEDEIVIPYNPLGQYIQYGHYNNFTSKFIAKVKEFDNNDKQNGREKLNEVQYNYYVPIKLVSQKDDGTYHFTKRTNAVNILSGDAESPIYPMLENLDYVNEQYDLIYGTFPQKKSNDTFTQEAVLVVGEGNKVNFEVLRSLGFDVNESMTEDYDVIDFEQICAKQYKIILNNDFYTPNSESFEETTAFTQLDTSNQAELETAYNNATYTLKISGIIRQKKGSNSSLLSAGLAYMADLEQFYAEDCKNSVIGQKSLQSKQNMEYKIYDPYKLEVYNISTMIPAFNSVAGINAYLNYKFGYTLSNEDAYELALQQIGVSSIPVSIKFYAKSFAAKQSVVDLIEKYNSDVDRKEDKIVYNDTSSLITNTLGKLIDIISYVLIAFAGISLIVSSIMIGIITYTSVIERIKEIGVLRSIGARKKDISRIFNMETFIIGLCSGLIGVCATCILSIFISIAINVATSGAVQNIASPRLDHMIAIVVVSITLSLIAGLIPSKIASKQDPVKALRSE